MHQKEKEKISHEHNIIFYTNITTQYSLTLRIPPFPAMISLLVFVNLVIRGIISYHT